MIIKYIVITIKRVNIATRDLKEMKNHLYKQTVKSQDDLNKPETHSTEVLLSTIDELERTKKQLEIAVDCLKYYGNEDKWTNCHSNWADCDTLSCLCDYGYKFAQDALKQIKELEK